MPPLIDSAGVVHGLGLGRGRGRRRRSGRVVASLRVADHNDGVIQCLTAVVASGDDTIFVELESSSTRIDSDGQGVCLQLLLRILDAVSDLAPASDFADGLGVIVRALSLPTICARSVGVRSVSHDTLLLLESPGVVHPAATAAPEAVGLAELLFVELVVGQCAVDELLLREAHGGRIVLSGHVAFEGRVRREGPAGPAATLLLHGVHVAVFDVVDGGCVGDEATTSAAGATNTTASSSAVVAVVTEVQVLDAGAGLLRLQAEMSGELRLSHVGEGVVGKSSGVSLTRLG